MPEFSLAEAYAGGRARVHLHLSGRFPDGPDDLCAVWQEELSTVGGSGEADWPLHLGTREDLSASHFHVYEVQVPVLVDIGQRFEATEGVEARVLSVVRLKLLDRCDYVRRYSSELLDVKVFDLVGDGETSVSPLAAGQRPRVGNARSVDQMIEGRSGILDSVASHGAERERRRGKSPEPVYFNFVRAVELHIGPDLIGFRWPFEEFSDRGIEAFEVMAGAVDFLNGAPMAVTIVRSRHEPPRAGLLRAYVEDATVGFEPT